MKQMVICTTYRGWPAELRVTDTGITVDADSSSGVMRRWIPRCQDGQVAEVPANDMEAQDLVGEVMRCGSARRVPRGILRWADNTAPPGMPQFGPARIGHLKSRPVSVRRAPRLSR